MDPLTFIVYAAVAAAVFLLALFYVIKNAVKAALEEQRADVARAAKRNTLE